METFANPCPSWFALLLRGLAAVVFGAVVLQQPGAGLVATALVFTAWVLGDAVLAIAAGKRCARRHERWAWFIVAAMVNIGAALVMLFWPAPTVPTLLAVLGAWAAASGVLMLFGALRFAAHHGRGCVALGGLLSLLAGGVLLFLPASAAFALPLWLAGFALLFGSTWLLLALRLWREGKAQPQAVAPQRTPRPAW